MFSWIFALLNTTQVRITLMTKLVNVVEKFDELLSVMLVYYLPFKILRFNSNLQFGT